MRGSGGIANVNAFNTEAVNIVLTDYLSGKGSAQAAAKAVATQ